MATENDIYTTALNDGMPEPLALLIVAQSKHETGGYSSHAFTAYNNAFGYSCVQGAKWQTGCGTLADNGLPLAIYDNVHDSTHELTDWIKRRVKDGRFPEDLSTITDPGEYAQLLKNAGYYGDTVSNYAAGIANWFSGNIAVAGGSIGIVLIIVFAAWIILKK